MNYEFIKMSEFLCPLNHNFEQRLGNGTQLILIIIIMTAISTIGCVALSIGVMRAGCRGEGFC